MGLKTSLAAAVLVLLAGEALAQTPEPVTKDAKCLALGSLMNLNTNNDSNTRQAGNILMMFYLGRISASGRSVDLDRALTVVRDETKAGAGPMRDECSAVFTAANGLLVARPDPANPPAPSRTTPAPGP